MKRTIKLFALIIFASMLLLSCSNDKKGDKSTSDLELRVLSRWSDEMPTSLYFRSFIEEYNAADNGVTIIGEHVNDEASYLDKLRTQFAIGEYPNIFFEYGGARILDYVQSQLILDLKPHLDADPEWRDSFLPVLDIWEYDGLDGIYGVPGEFYAVTLFYNQEIFDEVGVEPPATLKEFEEVSDKLLAAGYIPLALGEKDIWRGGHFLNNLVLKTFGAQGVHALADRSLAYDSPEMIELYALIQEYFNRGYFGKDAVSIDYNMEQAMFQNAETAMHMDGSWYCGPATQSAIAPYIKSIPFPSINEEFAGAFQGGAGGGWSIVDVNETQNEAAVDFVKQITGKSFFEQLLIENEGGVYPSKIDIDVSLLDPVTLSHMEAITSASVYRDDIQNYDSISSILDICRIAVQSLFVGSSPEKAAEMIVNEINIYE